MVKLEAITTIPTFSNQLENKVLYSNHADDISISYSSTYTLKYVLEGKKNYHCNHQDIEVSKNQYVILNTNAQITTEAKSGTKGLSFFLSPQLITEIYKYHNLSPKFLEVTQKTTNSAVGFLLNTIAQLYEHNQTAFKHQIDDLFIRLSELIVQEQKNMDTKFSTLKIVKHDTKKELFKRIQIAKEYLHDHIKEDISLDCISKDIGISKYYLHRLFTEINECTPLEYLTAIRIEKAKYRLRYSKDSIFETAIACGFDTAAYFSKIFKKHSGFSPTEFRKNI